MAEAHKDATDDAQRTVNPRRRIALFVAFALVVLLHLALFFHAEQDAPIFSGQPLTWIDFDTHAAQMMRVTDALAGWGKHWAYDVQLLAGYPAGTVFDADNKGWELWTYGLWKLGVPRPIAFNLFVLFAHLLVAPIVYWSARLFRLVPYEALLAVALSLCLWFFDGLARWSWFSGAVSYALVSVLFVLPLALFYAHLRTGRMWLLLPLAIAMSVGHLVHPSMFVVLVVPMTALYLRSFRKLSWPRHAAIVGVAAVVIGSNAWWLLTAFRYSHYLTDHKPFFLGSPHHVLLDMGGLIDDLTRTGLIGNRTGFRFLCLLPAFVTFLLWRNSRDDRFLPMVTGVGFLIVMAYFGSFLWAFRQIQPYRHIVSAAILASIPAAALAGEVWRRRSLHGLPHLAWAPIGIALFLGASHLATDILYFFPKSMPQVPPLPTGEQMPVSAYGFPEHRDFRHMPPEPHFDDVAKWVLEHDDGEGRFLVEWWVLGEHLLWRTQAQILGGFRERNLDHRAANLFYRYPQGHVPNEELAHYLEQYAVKWIIVSQELPIFEAKLALEKFATVGPHRIYRSRLPVSLLREAQGRVTASLNRIHVENTDPNKDIVLRFHWHDTLVCRPDCRIQRESLDDDPVGFLRIPAPHPETWTVINGY